MTGCCSLNRVLRVLTVAFATIAATAAVGGVGMVVSARPQPPADGPSPAKPKVAVFNADDPRARARMDQILDEWERRSSQIRSLHAEFRRRDQDVVLNEKTYFLGRAYLQAPNLAVLDFQSTDARFDPERAKPYERFVCTGDEVWHYVAEVREVVVYPLGTDERERALKEGPLPFLFNFKAAEAKRKYRMNLRREDDDAFYIEILPQTEEERDNFNQAIVKLLRSSFQPEQLMLIDENKNSKEFVFTRIDRNPQINPDYFKGREPGKSWKVIRNPAGVDRQSNPRRAAIPGADANSYDNPTRPVSGVGGDSVK